MTDPRAAVIGYGYAGRSFHSYLINLTPGLILHGVASSSAEKRAQIAQERRCKAYNSFDEVLADPAVDLVVLATPNDLHATYAIRAMEAGKHVVTDKPMAVTLDEAKQMVATAERTGKLLSIFQNRRWDGDYLTVRKLMDEGQLGNVRWIEMAWQRWGAPRGWRGEVAKGGGRLYDLGAHLLDQLLQLFPQPVEAVYCRLHHDFDHTNVESHALVTVHFADGATGVCDLSSMSAIVKPRFQIYGDKGTFIKYGLDPQEDAMRAGDIDAAVNSAESYGRLHDGTTEHVIPTVPGRWRSYYENVRDAIKGEAALAVKATEVQRVMTVIDAALRSAESSEVIQL
ncbi:MAG TPA: Gfo/Idh/MocA family oxidoreductase [Caldilineaceae bacterium]|nr:Gfo/Idh/MocA family oxidoreductase [Caldilineaceae bacterium]